MDPIRFSVRCIPVAQPRQRVAVIAGHAQTYTPIAAPCNMFKAAVAIAAEAAYGGPPLDCFLELELWFIFPRPANARWKTRAMHRQPYKGRCDHDNLAKSVCDALNRRLWTDDSWLCDTHVHKRMAAGDEQPHVEVEVRVL